MARKRIPRDLAALAYPGHALAQLLDRSNEPGGDLAADDRKPRHRRRRRAKIKGHLTGWPFLGRTEHAPNL